MTQTAVSTCSLKRLRIDYTMLIHASARLWKRGDFQASRIITHAREQLLREWPQSLPTVEQHQRTCAQCRVIWQGLGIRI